MRVAIFGAGTVGGNVARELSAEGNDVTLVDSDQATLNRIRDRLDINTVTGNAADPSLLKELGIGDIDLVLAVTDRDDTNIVTCELISAILDFEDGVQPTKIARLRNFEYLEHQHYFAKEYIAIDRIISPEKLVTEQFMRLIEYPWATQFVEFAHGKIQLAAIRALEGGALVGHEIRELREHMPNVDTRVAAIYRDDAPIMPHGDTVIQVNDTVFFIAARENISDVISELRPIDESYGKRVVLVGAGKIGVRLARELADRGFVVKLIELDLENAERAAAELENCMVLQGDAAEMEIMEQANIERTEVYCAVTNHDEANILTSMMAKKMGAKRTMALINNTAYAELLETTQNNIDVVVSPNLVTISELFRYVRARGRMEAIHSLHRGAAEAIEAIARKTSQVIGRTIAEIDLPQGTTVGAISRGDEVLIAHHDIEIEENDHIVLFVLDKDRKQIAHLERLFAVDIGFT